MTNLFASVGPFLTLSLVLATLGWTPVSARAQGWLWSEPFESGKVLRELIEEFVPFERRQVEGTPLLDDPIPDIKKVSYWARDRLSGREFKVGMYTYAPLRHGSIGEMFGPDGEKTLSITFEKLDPGMRWAHLDESYPGQVVRRITVRDPSSVANPIVIYRCIGHGKGMACFRLAQPENAHRLDETLIPMSAKEIVAALTGSILGAMERLGLAPRQGPGESQAPRTLPDSSRWEG